MAQFSKTRTVTISGQPTHFGAMAPVGLQSNLKALWCDLEIEEQIAEARAYVARIGGYTEAAEKYEAQAEACRRDLAGLSNCTYF